MKLNPSVIAYGIISTGIVGFIVVSWLLGMEGFSAGTHGWLVVLRHGFEGALVGGICDIIAVRGVYSAAREHFPSLRDNTTRVVIQDMVNVRKQIEDLSDLHVLLDNPTYQAQFVAEIEAFIPSRAQVDQKLVEMWSKNARVHLLNWLVDYKFSQTPKQFTEKYEVNTLVFRRGAIALLEDVAHRKEENTKLAEQVRRLSRDITLHDVGVPSEPEAVKHLLDTFYQRWTKDVRLPTLLQHGLPALIGFMSPLLANKVKTTSLEDTFGSMITEENLQSVLLSFAEKLEKNDGNSVLEHNQDLLEDIVSYWWVFVQAWENLDRSLRVEVVDELLRILEAPVLRAMGEQIWSLRLQLGDPQKLLQHEFAQQILDTIGTYLRERAGMIEETSIEMLQKQFDGMGAEGFVSMLQRNTQARLDWIKVNGSAWGFLLGAVVGTVGLLLEHLSQ